MNKKMESLTIKSILTLLTHEKQLELYDALHEQLLNSRTIETIEDRIGKIMEKYCDLVWMARSDPEFLEEHPAIKEIFIRKSEKYPGELEKLQSEAGSWHHGFNSGMLACSRLLSAYALSYGHRQIIDSDDEGNDIALTRDDEIQMAEDEFPMLDT